MIAAYLFLMGLVIGSFLNVCIVRLPRHESTVLPRSHCPRCGHQIAAYDNVPLLSYLWLRGKCRYCQVRISPLYFFIELMTGCVFLGLYLQFGPTLLLLKLLALACLLIILTVTDWRERILPDRVTFTGMVMGLLFSQIVPVRDGFVRLLARASDLAPLPWRVESALDSALGAAFGAGMLYVVGEVYFRLRHREGMGFGDVKMMAMTGFFLGPKLTFLTIFLEKQSNT